MTPICFVFIIINKQTMASADDEIMFFTSDEIIVVKK